MTDPTPSETTRNAQAHELAAANLLEITAPPNAAQMTSDQATALATRAHAHAQLATSLRTAELIAAVDRLTDQTDRVADQTDRLADETSAARRGFRS